jgi:transketolase
MTFLGLAKGFLSLAGHLQLGNLIAIYDDNHICIGRFHRHIRLRS